MSAKSVSFLSDYHLHTRLSDGSTADITCKIVRSERKSYSISVDQKGSVTVRAPLQASGIMISELIQGKSDWILTKRSEALYAASLRSLSLPLLRCPAETSGEKIPPRSHRISSQKGAFL